MIYTFFFWLGKWLFIHFIIFIRWNLLFLFQTIKSLFILIVFRRYYFFHLIIFSKCDVLHWNRIFSIFFINFLFIWMTQIERFNCIVVKLKWFTLFILYLFNLSNALLVDKLLFFKLRFLYKIINMLGVFLVNCLGFLSTKLYLNHWKLLSFLYLLLDLQLSLVIPIKLRLYFL